MSPEKGILQFYENQKRDQGELSAAEFAKTLREQFGDIILPFQSFEGGGTT